MCLIFCSLKLRLPKKDIPQIMYALAKLNLIAITLLLFSKLDNSDILVTCSSVASTFIAVVLLR